MLVFVDQKSLLKKAVKDAADEYCKMLDQIGDTEKLSLKLELGGFGCNVLIDASTAGVIQHD